MRATSVLVMMALVIGACGGSDEDASTTPSEDSPPSTSAVAPSTPASSEPETSAAATVTSTAPTSTTSTTVPAATAVADAVLIEPSVDLRATAAADFTPVADSEPVAVGDVVRTDRTGFAEIAYFDGSFTRLDVDTEFEVLELSDAVDGSTVRTRMGLGRTWHRVESLGEVGTFAVETSVATAVVQGTAFTVACAAEQSCTFTVIEGALVIELPDGTTVDLVAPAALTVDGDSATEPVPIPWDVAFGDEWLLDNAERDADAGFADAATVFEAHGPAFASMVGSYDGSRSITSITCTTFCGPDASEADVGFVGDLTLDLTTSCDTGDCAIVGGSGVPYAFDGTAYRATIPTVDEPGDGDCSYVPDDGTPPEVTGKVSQVSEVTLTPMAAETRDGVYVATELGYASVVTVSTDGFCAYGEDLASFDEYMALPPYGGYVSEWSGSVER
jgi:hypothetical protein